MDIDEAGHSQPPSRVERNGDHEDPWEETVNLESKFYEEGYQSGFDHGRLHGLFEGRELGQEKAWEIWEEVGFMQGFAMFWEEVLAGGQQQGQADPKGKSKDARALNHARQLLSLIADFPTSNPSSTTASPMPIQMQTASQTESESESKVLATGPDSSAEVDLTNLLSSIRARYKLLCTSLGVRPRLLIASSTDESSSLEDDGTRTRAGAAEGVVSGIEGPMKGVDTRQLRY